MFDIDKIKFLSPPEQQDFKLNSTKYFYYDPFYLNGICVYRKQNGDFYIDNERITNYKKWMKDNYEDVHIQTIDGKHVYWPKNDMSRLAPAAVCSVASRIVELRNLIKDNPDIPENVAKLINKPIAFEKEFLSGKSLDVHNGIKQLGEEIL